MQLANLLGELSGVVLVLLLETKAHGAVQHTGCVHTELPGR